MVYKYYVALHGADLYGVYIKCFKKIINSYATYTNLQSCLEGRVFYSPLRGSIDVGLPSENHHKISLIAGEDLLLNKGVVPLLWTTSYTISLSG
jgi:hypothetical protein